MFAAPQDKRINLSGKVKSDLPNVITPRYIAQQLPLVSFRVYNPWEKSTQNYRGVLLERFVEHFAKPSTQRVVFQAYDDYRVVMKKKNWESEPILLAIQVDDEFIPISKKGPMSIIFVNYDPDDKKYESNLSEWMWMINRIRFE